MLNMIIIIIVIVIVVVVVVVVVVEYFINNICSNDIIRNHDFLVKKKNGINKINFWLFIILYPFKNIYFIVHQYNYWIF